MPERPDVLRPAGVELRATPPRRRKVARTTLAALEADGGDAVVVPAGSCATMVRVFWPELFELVGDHDAAERARALGARTYELTEFLADARPARRCALAEPTASPTTTRATCCASCGSSDQPERAARPRSTAASGWPGRPTTGAAASAACSRSSCPRLSVAMADDKLASLGRRPTPDELVGCRHAPACCTSGPGPSTRAARCATRHLAQVLAEALPCRRR